MKVKQEKIDKYVITIERGPVGNKLFVIHKKGVALSDRPAFIAEDQVSAHRWIREIQGGKELMANA
jgi:hypothetical protein